jgi:archaellum component FlaF (FlaF/FlaG flagellin family)
MASMTLDQVVREYIIEKNDDTQHNYARLLQLGIHGLRELTMDVSGSPKIIGLTIKDDLTVDLPKDYIRYTKIGVCGSDGNVCAMGLNNDMCLPRSSDECGNPKIAIQKPSSTSVASQTDINFGYIGANQFSEGLTDNFRNGELVGRFFGIGGGQNSIGQYRVDTERNQIQFGGGLASTEIVMEYLADVSAVDGNYMIHPYLVECLKAYIGWASIRRINSVNGGEKEMARRDYYNERRRASERFSNFTIEEAMSMTRKAFKLAPKM